MSRVLVVEDNSRLAYGLRNNLEIEGYEVDVVGDGGEVMEQVAGQPPDLIVLDLMLPGSHGFRVLKDLRKAGYGMPILILTALGEETDKVRGLRLGADDYVTKPFGVLELLARVEALLRRTGKSQAQSRPPIQRFGAIEVDPAARTVKRGNRNVSLTPKEFDLLLLLIERSPAVVSRLESIRRVWGYSDQVVTRTVDTHISELRRKLEEDPSHPRFIVTVHKIGYRFEPGDPA